MGDIELVLVQLFVIIALAQVAKMVCTWIKVPTVIGEILVGILIVNTFIYDFIDLETNRDFFDVLKELGVIFLLFTVGLETPFSTLRKVGKTALLVATLGVILPFIAGFVFMTFMGYGELESLFVGAAMVATSVGITARVIKDLDLTQSIESRVIIGAAVIDDVMGMIVLAIVVGVAGGGSLDIIHVAVVSLEAVAFVLAVIFIGSLLLPKVVEKRQKKRLEQTCLTDKKKNGFNPLPLALIVCFALSALSAYLDLAAIIGAFLAGMAFGEFRDRFPCEQKIEPITEFLSPFFFIFVGIGVVLDAFSDVLLIAVILTILAIITKFIGCGLGSLKLGGKSAAIIGVGMIPRGEVGLIVASLGLSMFIVEEPIYNAVVFMCMATTLIAPALLVMTFKMKNKKQDKAPRFKTQEPQ
ncbi:MAG: cation:proton antiporter [Methanomassiliicoccales archaeon]|nr:cation:proton antiporter [Methanomassiliicoccales archaeon]